MMMRIFVILFCLLMLQCSQTDFDIMHHLQPVPKNGGFAMPGYFVWGGSVIYADGAYHLFASRWPTWETLGIDFATVKNSSMLGAYRDYSEIVHAVAADPLGPYEFVEVVLSSRGGTYWDGQMCHNPKIIKVDGEYVLFYIGRAVDSPLRKIGYARAQSINGPWQRSEHELALTADANNPAPFVKSDGSVVLAFRNQELHNYIAQADSFSGPYEIIAADITPHIRHEDPTLFFADGLYHMVSEDNAGGFTGHVRHGAHLFSVDGRDWQLFNPVHTYTHTIIWHDGDSTHFTRRERPELVNLSNPPELKYFGHPTHLLSGCLLENKSWCIVQEIK